MAPTTPARASDRIAVLRATISNIERHPAFPGSRLSLVPSGYDRFDSYLSGGLARGTLHDIHAEAAADSSATTGFALAWAARAQRAAPGRPVVWITQDAALRESGAPYGPGLAALGLDPDALILVHTVTLQETLWALEESLRIRAPAAIIGEFSGFPSGYDLTASRRLLLAAQAGQALGLLIFSGLGGSAAGATSAAATRFNVSSQPSVAEQEVPGWAAWRIDILKNRMGRTGQFSVEWRHDDIIFTEPRPAGSKTLLRHRLSNSADGSVASPRRSIRRAG